MINRTTVIICLFGLVFLVGCLQTDAVPTSQIEIVSVQTTLQPEGVSILEPYIFKTSEPGKATLRGLMNVLEPTVMLPDPNDAIFLVPLTTGDLSVSTIPMFVIGEVPQAEVDERTGEFVFTNIEPGTYAIVVVSLSGSQIPAHYFNDGSLAIVKIEEANLGQVIELGNLSFP